MATSTEIYRPLKVAGLFFIISGIFGALFFNYVNLAEEMDIASKVFITINIIIYLLSGIGLYYKTLWGFYILKAYLYLLILAFPIGTYISVKSLRYINENRIKEILKT